MPETSYITKNWTENYKVHQLNIERGHWFWGPLDKLSVIAQKEGEKEFLSFKVLRSDSSVEYKDNIEPKLTLHLRTVEGAHIPAYLQPWQPYERDEIVKAEFELPNGCFNFLLLGDFGVLE